MKNICILTDCGFDNKGEGVDVDLIIFNKVSGLFYELE